MEKHICIYVLVTRPICSRKVCQLDTEKGDGRHGRQGWGTCEGLHPSTRSPFVIWIVHHPDRHRNRPLSSKSSLWIVICHTNRHRYPSGMRGGEGYHPPSRLSSVFGSVFVECVFTGSIVVGSIFTGPPASSVIIGSVFVRSIDVGSAVFGLHI